MAVNSLKRPGDLVVGLESTEYCMFPAIIRNNTGSTVKLTAANMLGQPLKAGDNGADFLLAEAGDEANVIALLIDGPVGDEVATANNYPRRYKVLKNPPAIINEDALPAKDVLGEDLDVAAIVTALKALKFEFRKEPVNKSVLA